MAKELINSFADSRRRGLLAVAIAVMVVIGSVVLLIMYFRSTTSGSTAATQLGQGFLAHLQNIASKNDTAVALEYASNATFRVRSTTVDNITGSTTYQGARNISTYWCAYILCDHITTNFTIDNVSFTLKFAGEKALVNATFTMNGNPKCVFQSLVQVNVAYVNFSNKWLISQESWSVVDKHGTLCGGFSG